MSEARAGERGDEAGACARAMALLGARVNFERVPPSHIGSDALRLSRMRALMGALGNPERAFASVHVAGTKGKGSVCEMAAAGLGGCGVRVGLYTSPHVMDVRERVRVDGAMISEGEFAAAHEAVVQAEAGVAREHGPATYFEVLTAMAFWHFARARVEVAVVEVGLGGRLDSTNVITPLAVGVTAIQMEHTQVLGGTLELIAREKAGIFKPGVAAFTIPQTRGVIEVFRERAAAIGCPLGVLGRDVAVRIERGVGTREGRGDRVSLVVGGLSMERVPVPLAGEHQAMNLALALSLVGAARQGAPRESSLKRVSADGLIRGLARTANAARAEVVRDDSRGTIIVDGAHTPESVRAILQTLRGSHGTTRERLRVVFGCASDKDAGGMLGVIVDQASLVVLTRASDNKRAMTPDALRGLVDPGAAIRVERCETVAEAMARACAPLRGDESGRGMVVLATGSFVIAGEAKRWARDAE